MALKHSSGDLLAQAKKGKYDVIVQGCNCFCTMGSGIAKQIREQFPRAYEADKATKSGDRNKLGTYSVALGKQFNIINAYTQYGFNRGGANEDVFEYEAFQKILDKLVEEYPGCRFGFPAIGCGLAGGNEERIVGMLEEFALRVEETGGTVTLVKYMPAAR